MPNETVQNRLSTIRKVRFYKRAEPLKEFAHRNGVSFRTAYRWLQRFRQRDIQFDTDGKPRRKLRRDRGVGKKYTYSYADIPKIKALLVDPDRSLRSIAKELAMPTRFVQAVASGRFT